MMAPSMCNYAYGQYCRHTPGWSLWIIDIHLNDHSLFEYNDIYPNKAHLFLFIFRIATHVHRIQCYVIIITAYCKIA